MDRPDAMDRKVSFNPEAATFSPVAIPAQPSGTAVAHDSPLKPNTSPGAGNSDNTGQGLETISINELASMGVPVEVLVRTFEQHSSSNQALKYIGGSLHGYLPSSSAVDHAQPFQLQPSLFPSYNPESNYKTADIDELNASLGLPGAKPGSTPQASPARGHRSQLSQGTHDEVLYGKLIDRAMSKPMTAEALARYMQSRSESSDETVRPSRMRSDSHRDQHTEDVPALKFVRAPPGFGDQQPRIVAEETPQVSIDPISALRNVPLAPAAYFQQQPHFPQPAVPLQTHANRTPTIRRIRSYTRTRRTDQGPEPSAADIYPDDAHWTPPQAAPRYQYPVPPTYAHPVPQPQSQPQPQPVVRAEDSMAWPTPAEVYDPKAKAPSSAHVPQNTETREEHVPPTADDFAAADAAVLSLLDELPEPRITTLLNFGALDLLGDERPLSPAQESGKRYGLNFNGIGLADPWMPPQASQGDPFRVRPRNHEGWGGWEWAMKNGWAMQ